MSFFTIKDDSSFSSLTGKKGNQESRTSININAVAKNPIAIFFFKAALTYNGSNCLHKSISHWKTKVLKIQKTKVFENKNFSESSINTVFSQIQTVSFAGNRYN